MLEIGFVFVCFFFLPQLKIKVEKMDEDEEEDVVKSAGEEQEMEIKKEVEEEVMKSQLTEADDEGGAKPEPEMGRLVMTIDGEQKQLPFGPDDLLSTATMLDGDKVSQSDPWEDLHLQSAWIVVCSSEVTGFFMFLLLKVRFNIATHRETKVERATYVEILPESFEESIEQRRHVRLLK